MNVKFASRFESLLDFVNDRMLTRQQLLAISKQMVALSDQTSTDLRSTTAGAQVESCRVSLDRAHKTLKFMHISIPEMFICVQSRKLHNKLSGHTQTFDPINCQY